MKEFDFTNQVRNLPDSFAKYPDSNNAKILDIEKLAVDDFETDMQAILNSLDIEQATGKTLDLYGEVVQQPRGTATDEQYRVLLKSKIMQNFSTGDFKSVLKSLYLAFSCEPSEIAIIEEASPCTVKVTKLPFGIAAEIGMSQAQMIQIIKQLLPTGVLLTSVTFEGTFELAATEADMSTDGNTKGLTNTEADISSESAIGGTLGSILG